MMTTTTDDDLLLIEDVAVVFDDVSRIRWRRSTSGWTLQDPWPSHSEALAFRLHLATRGTALVLTDDQPIRVHALASELPTTRDADGPAVEPVEVAAEHFDWLPEAPRLRGESFIAQQKDYWSTRPALLRPPLTLSSSDPFWDLRRPGHVNFALTAPGISRGRIQRDLAHALTFLRSYREAENRGLDT